LVLGRILFEVPRGYLLLPVVPEKTLRGGGSGSRSPPWLDTVGQP
jgi:hypothetical protein